MHRHRDDDEEDDDWYHHQQLLDGEELQSLFRQCSSCLSQLLDAYCLWPPRYDDQQRAAIAFIFDGMEPLVLDRMMETWGDTGG